MAIFFKKILTNFDILACFYDLEMGNYEKSQLLLKKLTIFEILFDVKKKKSYISKKLLSEI